MAAVNKKLNNSEALEAVQKRISEVLRMKLPRAKHVRALWMEHLLELREVERNICSDLQNEEAN